MSIKLESTTLTTSSFNSVIIVDGIRYAVNFEVEYQSDSGIESIIVTDILNDISEQTQNNLVIKIEEFLYDNEHLFSE